MKIGLFHLWLVFIPAYGIIWLSMIWANKKRGKPIEASENSAGYGKTAGFIMGYLPLIGVTVLSLFVAIQSGLLFWIGLVLLVLGMAVNLAAMVSFARFRGDLNTTGIYRFSRNPMYVGGFLLILGLNTLAFTNSWLFFAFVCVSLFWIAAIHWNVRREETFLSQMHGSAFEQFMQQVPRYIGFIKRQNPS